MGKSQVFNTCCRAAAFCSIRAASLFTCMPPAISTPNSATYKRLATSALRRSRPSAKATSQPISAPSRVGKNGVNSTASAMQTTKPALAPP